MPLGAWADHAALTDDVLSTKVRRLPPGQAAPGGHLRPAAGLGQAQGAGCPARQAIRRWDDDDRHIGVADASGFAPAIDELARLARRPGWVAEDPGAHLAPHLRQASVPGLRLLDIHASHDGALHATAEHSPGASRRDIRRQAWTLIGAIAEPAASVHEHADGDLVTFDVVTGIPDGGPFASHGHTLRLTVQPPTAPLPQHHPAQQASPLSPPSGSAPLTHRASASLPRPVTLRQRTLPGHRTLIWLVLAR